ncbi:MAG: hypothetical protein F6J89_05485 [Symploca sp. SIO1C4]|uniref:Fibrillin n=1 Tax=Symploca sp. SIO1C4 TaxID=2607765 RepID=A0A6B3N690_9CYAN|nr:hypothetical protein [Symploca sp. SIO1C4]NET04792.1 hypothetical protein [Symploca sp. SIO2B6]NET51432.1 hypothetical protein [Merismopedia sp. SIO2A8]
MENSSLLEQIVKSFSTNSVSKPSPSLVVEALLEAEKNAKKRQLNYCFEQLLGCWQLYFVTGTKKKRNKAGILLGAGRYLPKLITIKLSYSKTTLGLPPEQTEAGIVENLVDLGILKLVLTGPMQFLVQKNILAFDFTRMQVQLFGFKLYDGFIRGGSESEQNFYQIGVSKQAFFSYFLIQEEMIAARGRGGGLALWVKSE